MILVDVHAHNYYSEKEVSYDENIIVIETGTDHISNVKCIELSEKYSKVKAAIGWHPTYSLSEKDYLKAKEEINFIKSKSEKIVAIGEIGLDYFHNKEENAKIWQKKTFGDYIKLADELDLPIVVHARNAVKDVLEILKNEEFSGKVVMHCMEANEKNIKIAIERGYFFTIPASVGRNEMFQRLVKLVPTSKMLTETDAPYQGPVKGEKANSKDVIYAIKYIAENNNLDEEEVQNMMYMNYNKVF